MSKIITVIATAPPVQATFVSAEPVPIHMQRYEDPNQDPNIAIGEWDNGLCGCCYHKECGSLCCIVNFCFCGLCTYASNVSQSGLTPCGVEKDSLCCHTICIHLCCSYCCGPQLWNFSLRRKHARKYGFKESDCESMCYACCCLFCSMCQVTNEIMVRKNLTYECGQVKPDNIHLTQHLTQHQ